MATPEMTYRYVPLPKQWPGKRRPSGRAPTRSPFKVTTWSPIERLLSRELGYLGAKDVTIALDIQNPMYWRMDGGLRSDARTITPGVIVSFTGKDGVRFTFPCDTYGDWQTNAYAIAVTLEKLRAIARYGVTQGDQQYVGFKALPSGASSAPARMTAEDAADLLAEYSPFPARLILNEPVIAGEAIKAAKRKTHPDAGGASDAFAKVTEAADVLAALNDESSSTPS